MSEQVYAEGLTAEEYAAARHRPGKDERLCMAATLFYRGDSMREVHCDWVEGHPGPHNQFKGDYVWSERR